MALALKDNWNRTKQHFVDWWDHKGFVVGTWESGITRKSPNFQNIKHGQEVSLLQQYTNAKRRAERNHYELSLRSFPLDILPFSDTDIGPGSLCIYLGCKPDFAEDTVWYHPCIVNGDKYPPLTFDPQQEWWQIHEAIIYECIQKAQNNYFVGIPDLAEGVDILASLRGTEKLMMDMIDMPGWVKQKLDEIDTAYFEVYQRIYDIVHVEDEGCVFRAFCLWSPGRVAKVQCDIAAMLSPMMFKEFSVPYLKKQCSWLDHSMFHLDGTQCIVHLDALLQIEQLDAIEWTPQSGLPGGADKEWHEMYKRILDAGKSLQVVGVKPDEIIPLLDSIGTEGVYILSQLENEEQCQNIAKKIENYR